MKFKMGFVTESILLLISFVFLFIWEQANLTLYTPQIIGLLVFLFIIFSAGRKRQVSLSGPWGVFILNTVIFMVIFSTGGISSSFFFVLYFVVFAMAFVFDPNLAFIFAAGSLIVFLPVVGQGNTVENIIKIASLFLISPLAYFLGNMFKRQEKQDDKVVAVKERATDAASTISKDVEEVIKEDPNLKPQEVEKLNEVLEETEDLRAESKE